MKLIAYSPKTMIMVACIRTFHFSGMEPVFVNSKGIPYIVSESTGFSQQLYS